MSSGVRRGIFPSFHLVPSIVISDISLLKSSALCVLWVINVALPMVACILFLAVFLPYHSVVISWGQRFAIFIDSIIVLFFWPNIIAKIDDKCVGVKGICLYVLKLTRNSGSFTVGFVGVVVVLSLLLSFPGECIDFYGDSCWFDGVVPRTISLNNKLLVKSDPNAGLISARWHTGIEYYDLLAEVVKLQHAGLDLRGRDLRGAVFSGCIMPGAIFTGTDLRGADFSRAHLENVTFGDENLVDIDQGEKVAERLMRRNDVVEKTAFEFQQSRCEKGEQWLDVLRKNDLREIYGLSKKILTKMDNCKFDRSVIKNSSLSSVSCKRCSFKGAIITNSGLMFSDLCGSQFSNVWASNADFSGAKMVGSRCGGSMFDNVLFAMCDMSAAEIGNTEFVLSDFSGCKFEAAEIFDCFFKHSAFIGVEISKSFIGTNAVKGSVLMGNDVKDSVIDYTWFGQIEEGVPNFEEVVEAVTDKRYRLRNGAVVFYILKEGVDGYICNNAILNCADAGFFSITSERNYEYASRLRAEYYDKYFQRKFDIKE